MANPEDSFAFPTSRSAQNKKTTSALPDLPGHIRDAFSDEEIRQNKELFDSFDDDGGGTIDAEEFVSLAAALGLSLTVDGAVALIEEIDIDGDGLVDFTEFLTLMMDMRRGGLDRNKKKKSAQLTKLMNLAVQRADEVRARKQQQIDEVQRAKELRVVEAEKVREAQVQALLIKKQEEQQKVIALSSAKTAMTEQRLKEIELQKEREIAQRDVVIRQRMEEGQIRAAREKEAVFREAALKAEKTQEALLVATRRKQEALIDDERQRVEAEMARQQVRAVNARRADIERGFTRTQLEALREQFEAADTDNSQSIDAAELHALCQQMGENMTMKQVRALIAEVDDDGSGEIEWEEYLLVMGKKKNEAAKRGAGLFQRMAMKAEEAARRKEERILKKQAEKEASLAVSQEERAAAVARAQQAKVVEQQAIVARNIAAEEAALERAQQVEVEKSMALQRKAQELGMKEQLGQMRAMQAQEEVWAIAEAKRARTEANAERSAWMREQKIIADEQARVEAEKGREVKRAVNLRRATIERGFTRTQLEALREQFETADTDNSQSIDAAELHVVCQQMGEDMTLKQVKALIQTVDEDGSGEIEWEEYLIIMGQKKNDAARTGSGLFQKWSQRAKEVANSKEEQAQAMQTEKEARAAVASKERDAAVVRAAEAAAIEKEAIAKRNETMRVAAIERQIAIDRAKEMEIAARGEVAKAKAAAGRERAAREKEAVLKEAAIKAEKTRRASTIAIQRRKSAIEETEKEKAAAEIERQIRREANVKRAKVEALFTPQDLKALRDQFESADTDGSGSIDAEEMGTICAELGEKLSKKQLRALIKEVDTNGNGTVEWEEFLGAMFEKRKNARKNGKGLLEKFSIKLEAANRKKEEQIKARIAEAEVKAVAAAKDREIKKKAAAEAKELERLEIIKRNKAKQAKGLAGAEKVEIAKQLAEKEKEARIEEAEKKAKQVKKDIAKREKAAVLEKKKARAEAQAAAEIRRQKKEEFEEAQRVLKEKIVNAKSQGKHSVVRLLQDKLKQMTLDMNSATPKRPKKGGKGKLQRPGQGNKDKRKVYNPAAESAKKAQSVYG